MKMKCLIYNVYSKAETILVGGGGGGGTLGEGLEGRGLKGDRLARGPCAPGVTVESLGSRARSTRSGGLRPSPVPPAWAHSAGGLAAGRTATPGGRRQPGAVARPRHRRAGAAGWQLPATFLRCRPHPARP